MAFPQVLSVTESQFSTGAGDHDVAMPATVAENDLLIILFSCRGAGGVSTPTDWTAKWVTESSGRSACFVLKPTLVQAAALSGGVVNVDIGGAPPAVAQVIRISAASWSQDLADVQVGTTNAQGNTSSPDPPPVTASFGSADNLFIVVLCANDDDETVSTYPTNYSNGVDTISGAGSNGATVAHARRELASDTDNPGIFSLSGSQNSHTNTIVIRPAAAANVVITVPALSFNVTVNTPIVGTGARAVVPHKAFDLSLFAPTVQTGVTVAVPQFLYDLNLFNPVINTGVAVAVPAFLYNLNLFNPSIQTGVTVIVPAFVYDLNAFAPVAGVGAVIQAPAFLYDLNLLVPSIGSGINVIVPHFGFDLANFVPVIGTGVSIVSPGVVFNLTVFIPNLLTSILVSVPVKTFDLTATTPDVTAFTISFPEVLSVTQFQSITEPHNVTLPDSINENDLLILICACRATGGIPTPTNWTLKFVSDPGSIGRFACFVIKPTAIQAAAMAGSTVLVDPGGTPALAAQVIRINAETWSQSIADVEFAAVVTGTNNAPNPGAVIASWGSAPNLLLSIAGANKDDVAFTGFPTNYTNGISTISGAGFNDGASVGSARRELNTDTDNPSAFTLASSQNWHASTLIVRPAEAGLVALDVPHFNFDFVANRSVPIAGIEEWLVTGDGAPIITGDGEVIEINLETVGINVPHALFDFNRFIPGIAAGAGIIVPHFAFEHTQFVPFVGHGVLADVPVFAYEIISFIPTIGNPKASISVPRFRFSTQHFSPIVHSTGVIILTHVDLDLTPPFEDIGQARYLYENFEIVRNILSPGPTVQFTTTDGKTVLVRNGVIVDVY